MSKSDDLKNRLDEIFSTIPAPIVLEPEVELTPLQIAPAPEPVTLEAAAFETAFELAAVGIVLTTKDGRFLRVNDAFCRMLGYERKELEGRDFQSLTYKEDLPVGSDAMKDMLAGKSKTAQIRKRYIHKSSILIWVELNITLLLDETGKPLHFVTIVHDVTEQFRTSDILEKRVSELDCLNDIGHKIDEKSPVPEFLQWITGRIPLAFQDPGNCIAAVEFDGRLYGNEQALRLQSKSVAGIRRAGELVGWLHIAYTKPRAFADNESRLLGGIASRISSYVESQYLNDEVKAALDEARSNREFLSGLLDAIHDPIFVKDEEHRWVVSNKSFTEVLGLPMEDFIGKSDFDLLPEDQARVFWEKDDLVFKTEQMNVNEEKIRWGGRDRDISTVKTVFKNPVTGEKYIVATIRDITDRKLTETQVEKRASQLATVAKLSTSVAESLNTQELLQLVVDLTKENFELYHAHIYMLDENNKNLVLAAGATEIGRIMVSQGWKIPVAREQSLVARATREHQGVIVNNVQDDPGFLPNELLPETRSEMAVPLMVGDQLLGVLDVQSDKAGYFTQEDINIMTALASQVAVALQNARRFEAVQSSERLIRSIIDSTPDWIFVKDRQHRMVLNNVSFARALGRTPEDFIGKTDLELGFPEETVMGDPEKGIQGYWWDDQRVMDTGEPQVIKSEPNIIDGEQVYFDVYKIPLYDAAGNIWGLLGFARDITERQQLLNEVSQNVQALVTLNEMSRSLAAALDLESVVKDTYDYSSRFMDTTNFYVALYDHETNIVTFPMCYLDGVLTEMPTRSLGSEGLTDYIINHHQPLLFSQDVLEGMRQYGINFVALGDDEPSQSWLGVPMMYGDEVIGVITVQSTTNPGLYTERERELLSSIANQASSAFRLVQQYQHARDALEAVEALYTGSARIIGAADAQETLSALVEATALNQFDHSSILFFDTPWQDIMPTYGTLMAVYEKFGEIPVSSLGTVNDLAEIPFTSMICRNEPIFIPDVQSEERLDPAARSFIKGSLALFPLAIGDNWFGWVASMADKPIVIHTEDIRRISSLVDQAATVLQSQRLEKSMEERLNELTALQRLMSREAWSAYQPHAATDVVGYLFDRVNLKPVTQEMIPVFGNGSSTGEGTALTSYKSSHTTTLAVRGEPIGMLGIEPETHQMLSPQDEEFLQAISDQVAQALERARLMEQTQRSAVELQAVAEVGTATATILEPQSLLQRVVDLTKDRFGLYQAHIYLLDEADNSLVLTAGAGTIGRSMVLEGWSIPFDREDSIVARTARTRQGQIVDDVEKEPGFLRNPLLPETRSELAVPIIVADKLLGVFDAQSNVLGRFSTDDIRTYNTLAAQMGIALQNAKLYAEQLDTVERLRELDNMKSAFLANMSHELRTPLNSILGFAQVIMEGLDGPVTDTMTSDLELVEKNGKHLLHLINDVLDMARIEAGRLTLSPEPTNMYNLLEDVIMTNAPLVREKDLDLQLIADPLSDWTIFVDQMRIRQILINLIGNSIKFTEKGSIFVEMEKKQTPDRQDLDKLMVRVRDTGIGIPQDRLEEIFEAFSQIDSSTTRKVGGTGLGLPISRRLVEMHGGRLWAESEGLGKGTALFLELPFKKE
jgi:PAS domain S-box-containing protein